MKKKVKSKNTIVNEYIMAASQIECLEQAIHGRTTTLSQAIYNLGLKIDKLSQDLYPVKLLNNQITEFLKSLENKPEEKKRKKFLGIF